MRGAGRQLTRIAAMVLLSGIACGFLVRYSPGAIDDERQLHPRASNETIEALRDQREAKLGVWTYFRGLAHGDLGYSESNHASITTLLKDRAPATFREV